MFITKQKKKFRLSITSNNDKLVLVKDGKGNSTSFKNTLVVNIKIIDQNNNQRELNFEETFEYNNNINKIELRRYEKEIKNNLTETIVNNLIFELSKIKWF